MKKALFILLCFCSLQSIAQDGSFKQLNVTKKLSIAGYPLKGVVNDMADDSASTDKVPTVSAVYEWVRTHGGIGGGSGTDTVSLSNRINTRAKSSDVDSAKGNIRTEIASIDLAKVLAIGNSANINMTTAGINVRAAILTTNSGQGTFNPFTGGAIINAYKRNSDGSYSPGTLNLTGSDFHMIFTGNYTGNFGDILWGANTKMYMAAADSMQLISPLYTFSLKNNASLDSIAAFDQYGHLKQILKTSGGGEPLFTASPAYSITSGYISNWNAAFGWGNHAGAGYLLKSDTASMLDDYLRKADFDTSKTQIPIRDVAINGDDSTAFSSNGARDLADSILNARLYTGNYGVAKVGNDFRIGSGFLQSDIQWQGWDFVNPKRDFRIILADTITLSAIGYLYLNSGNAAMGIDGIGNGTLNFMIRNDSALANAKRIIFNGRDSTEINSPKIYFKTGIAPVNGYVWTADGTTGLGKWAAATGGGGGGSQDLQSVLTEGNEAPGYDATFGNLYVRPTSDAETAVGLDITRPTGGVTIKGKVYTSGAWVNGNLNVESTDFNVNDELHVFPTSTKIASLAGSGPRMVVADGSGGLSAVALPGTVNSGSANRLSYYASSGTAVSQLAAMTANRLMLTDANGLPVHSIVTNVEVSYLSGITSGVQSQINAKAPLVSPGLTGTPTAPTATHGTKTDQIATTDFVQRAKDSIVSNTYGIYVAKFTTTGTTPVNVDTLALTNGTGGSIEVTAKGTLSDGNGLYMSKKINFFLKNNSGVVTGSTTTDIKANTYLGTGLSTATVTIELISSTHAIIKAVGESGDTINWELTYTK